MDDWIERKDRMCTAMYRYRYRYRERKRATKNTVFRERIGVREEKGLDLDVGTFYAVSIRICFLLSGFGFGCGFGYH